MTSDFESPAERRLDEHMELVRAEAPEPSPRLTLGVVRTVRWQRALVVPVRASAAVALGFAAGVRALFPGRGASR